MPAVPRWTTASPLGLALLLSWLPLDAPGAGIAVEPIARHNGALDPGVMLEGVEGEACGSMAISGTGVAFQVAHLVPQPAGAVLMGLGLAGLAFLRRS
jgi:hypothetical protein